MPGALDVLIEIGFEADEAGMKEISSLLEKEGNIIKTVEERLRLLNEARMKQGASLSDIKAINTEYEKTSKVLNQLKGGYKEIDYGSQALLRQKGAASALVNVLKEAPSFAKSFQAGMIGVSGQLPAFVKEVQGLAKANAGLVAQGKPAVSLFSALGSSITKLPNLISLAGFALSAYSMIMEENAKRAEELKKRTEDLTSSIKDEADALQEMTDRFEYIDAGEDGTVNAANRKAERVKAEGVVNGKIYQADKKQFDAQQEVRDKEIGHLNRKIELNKKLKEVMEDAARSVNPDKDKLWGPKNIDFIKKQFKMAPAGIPQKTLDDIAGKMEKLELKGEALADGLFKAAEEIDKETERMNTELANKVNQQESERIAFHSKVNEKVYNLNVDLQERLTKLRKDNEDEAAQYGAKTTEESIRERIKKDEEYALKKLRKEREKARKDGSLNGENTALFDQLEKATQAKYVNIAKAQIAEYLRKKMQELEQFYKELTGKELQNEQDALKLRPDDLNLRKQVIRDETRYNEGKVIAEYDELEQKSQGKDAVRITRDKIAAINNVRKEGNAKMLAAETEHYDQLNALVEQRYDIVMDYLEAELNEKISATNDPAQKEELKKQAESLKYYREEQKLLELLANGKEKLKRIEAERKKGGNSVVTEKDVLEARRNVSSIIAQIAKLISARKALEEADKHEKKKRILGEVDYTAGNVDKTIQGIGSILNAFIDAEQQKTAVLIEEQQKRVNRANEIAKGGNTEMLKAEQDRLAALEKKQRDYVDKQRFLNSLLIASQQAVNITQAITGVLSAAPGDPYSLPARVIAAVAAIVFGIAAVTTSLTSINSKTGYAKGGYTGDGGRHDEAGVVHKGEYVMPQDTVKRYGRQTLEAIHYGRIPIEALQGNMMQVNYAGMLRAHNSARVGNAYDMRKLEGKFDLLLEAYNNNGGTQVSIDENGFVAIYNQHVKNKTRINKLR